MILGLTGELVAAYGAVDDLVISSGYLAGRGSIVLDLNFAGSMSGKLMILGLTGELFTAPGAVDDLVISTGNFAGRGSIVLDLNFAGSMGMRRSDLAGER